MSEGSNYISPAGQIGTFYIYLGLPRYELGPEVCRQSPHYRCSLRHPQHQPRRSADFASLSSSSRPSCIIILLQSSLVISNIILTRQQSSQLSLLHNLHKRLLNIYSETLEHTELKDWKSNNNKVFSPIFTQYSPAYLMSRSFTEIIRPSFFQIRVESPRNIIQHFS